MLHTLGLYVTCNLKQFGTYKPMLARNAPNMFYVCLANNHKYFVCFCFVNKICIIFPIDDKITSSKLTRLMRGPPEFPTYKITEKPHYNKSYNGF